MPACVEKDILAARETHTLRLSMPKTKSSNSKSERMKSFARKHKKALAAGAAGSAAAGATIAYGVYLKREYDAAKKAKDSTLDHHNPEVRKFNEARFKKAKRDYERFRLPLLKARHARIKYEMAKREKAKKASAK